MCHFCHGVLFRRWCGGGVYKTYTLNLKNGVDLHIDRGATLKGGEDPYKYPEFKPTPVWRPERSPLFNKRAMFYTVGQTNVSITGAGRMRHSLGSIPTFRSSAMSLRRTDSTASVSLAGPRADTTTSIPIMTRATKWAVCDFQRDKAKYLLRGTFVDNEGFVCENPALLAKRFVAESATGLLDADSLRLYVY